MESAAPVSPPPDAAAPGKRRWWMWGSSFLTISIIVHLVLGVGAAYLIVQRIAANGKPTFAAATAPSAPAAASREHKVQMQKKQQSMTAPAQMKRVTTIAPNTQIALPQMSTLPTLSTSLSPITMSGMSGSAGLSMGGGPGGGSPGSGRPVSLFGFVGYGAGLEGTFYDLKQTSTGKPTNMTPEMYGKIVMDFVVGGFNGGLLSRYFKSDRKVYAPAIWIPRIPADLGPAAFQLQDVVKPRLWCVHYKGRVTAPASFTFHFVGAGDDLMLVRFNGKLVLDRCWYVHTNWHSQADYSYDFSGIGHGFAKGDAIKVEAGKSYPMEVLIGEQPGGESFATLLQEVDGAPYEKDAKGNPILPVFRMSDSKPASSTSERPYPPHRDDGPIWKVDQSPSN